MALIFHVVASGLMMSSFFYCFIFVDANGKGKRSSVKQFLYITCPDMFKSCLRKVGCEPVAATIEGGTTYLCFSANPFLQFMYLILAVGGYYLFAVYGFQHLPNEYRSIVH